MVINGQLRRKTAKILENVTNENEKKGLTINYKTECIVIIKMQGRKYET